MSSVRVAFYLIVQQKFDKYNRQSGRPQVRAAKTKPDCGRDEVAVAMTLELPDSLFLRPSLQAKISVPENGVPLVITPEIEQNIANVVREQLGITMHVSSEATS